MKLVTIGRAGRLLGMDPGTLRRRESTDGKWAYVYGNRIRVYRTDFSSYSQRRYDEDEIRRLLDAMQKEAAGR